MNGSSFEQLMYSSLIVSGFWSFNMVLAGRLIHRRKIAKLYNENNENNEK